MLQFGIYISQDIHRKCLPKVLTNILKYSRITSATEVCKNHNVTPNRLTSMNVTQLKCTRLTSESEIFTEMFEIKLPRKCSTMRKQQCKESILTRKFLKPQKTTTQHTPPTHPHSRKKRTVSLVNQTIISDNKNLTRTVFREKQGSPLQKRAVTNKQLHSRKPRIVFAKNNPQSIQTTSHRRYLPQKCSPQNLF